jgi:hypothetical protein
MTSVMSEASGSSRTRLRISRKKPSFAMWIPSSLGIWSSTITSPIPALNPVSTGAEMKFATKPRRSTDAAISRPPASALSVAVAVISRPGSPSGTASPNCVATRMARVVVELTLSTREVPSSA